MNSVLIVLFDNLGDTVMATSVIRPLRAHLPGVRLGAWVKSYAAGLFEGTGLVERVHGADPFWDRSPGRAAGSRSDFWRALREVRAARYDAALVLNAEWRRALACRLSGIGARVGFGRRKSGIFLSHAFASPAGDDHFTADHRRLLEQWTGRLIDPGAALPFLTCSSDDEKAADAWLAAAGWAPRSFVAVHPFSGDERKNWPMDLWARVFRELGARHPSLNFLVTCGASEESRVPAVIDGLTPLRLRVLAGAPLGLLKGLLARAAGFAGGDSGPGHIAAALGTPVVSLFGPTNPARSRPIGPAVVRLLREADVAAIPVSSVVRELDTLLQTVRSHARA